MTETVASVAVAIGADLTGLSAGLAQAQSKIKAVGDKLGDIGKKLTTFVTAPIIGLGVAVTKMAINWESDFAGVEKTVDGTAEQLAALEDQLLRTSRQIPITPEQIAKISELGGQLGVQIGDIDAFAQEIAKLGVTTDLGTEQAAMGMARFINITQKVAPEGATFIDQTKAIGATLVDLGNNFAATESEIMEFAMRIAGAGSIVGLTQAEILGWSVGLASMGINAEAGGTAISRVFLEISNVVQGATGSVIDNSEAIEKGQAKIDKWTQQLLVAKLRQSEFTDKTKESTRASNEFTIENLTAQIRDQESALESLTAAHGDAAGAGEKMALLTRVAGVSVEEFSFLMKENASKATAMFVAGLGRMRDSGENILPILEALGFSNVRIQDTVLRLSSSTDVLDKALGASGEAYEDMNALNVEAAKRFKTTESQIQIVRNTFHYLGVVLGKQVLPVIIDVLGKVGPLVEKFAEFIKARPDIIQFGLAVAGVAAAAGPLAMGLGVVLPLIGALISPLGLVLAGVAALVVGFVKAEGGIVPAIEAVIDKVKGIAKAVKAGDWPAVWEELRGIGDTIVSIIGGWIDTAKRVVGEKWEGFKTNVAGKWATLKDVFTAEGWVAAIETALGFAGIEIDFSELIENLRPKWNAVKMIFEEKGFIEAVQTALLFAGVVVDFSALGAKVEAAWNDMWLGKEIPGVVWEAGELKPLREGGLKATIVSIGAQIPGWITEGLQAGTDWLAGITERGVEWAESAETQEALEAIGYKIAGGIFAGIEALFSDTEESEAVMEVLAESLGIAASNVGDIFIAIGKGLAKGIAQGVVDELASEETRSAWSEAVRKAIEKVAEQVKIITRPLTWKEDWKKLLPPLGGEGEEGPASHFQRGGIVGRGGLALVGEAGPELAWLPRATRVTPAAETQELLAGRGQPQISLVQHFYGRADAAQVKEAASEGLMEGLQAAGVAW